VGSEQCTECLAGTYAAAKDKACKVCEVGKYQDKAGQTTCKACSVGEIPNSDKTGCVKCSAGEEYYAVGSGECDYPSNPARTTATDVAVTDPTACTEVKCRACTAGYYNPADSIKYCHRCTPAKKYTTDQTSCTECTAGQVANALGTGCDKCAAGKKRESTDDDCVDCAAGSISKAGEATCTKCEKGKYEVSKTSCEDCPVGKYNKVEGKSGDSSCIDCPDGSVAATTGTDECTKCTPGNYAKSKDKQCEPCPGGKFQGSAEKTSCDDCPPGHISTGGASVCKACEEGKEQNADQTACNECKVGFHQPTAGQAACIKCGEGKYAATTGKKTCDTCEAGQEANLARTACDDCAAGKYQEKTDGGACQDCAAGTFSKNAKSPECSKCPVGEFQDGTGKDSCKKCPTGKYNAVEGATECLDCKAGHVTSAEGMAKCVACQPGFYSNDGLTACVKCAAGEYQDQTGQSACKPCSANKYSKDAGFKECDRCPENEYARKGSATCIKCPAKPGLSPDDMEKEMKAILNMKDSDSDTVKEENKALIEKCKSDMGQGCASETYNNQYVTDFKHNWLTEDESVTVECSHDPGRNAKFTCKKNNEGKMIVEEIYYCQKTAKTQEIEDLAEKLADEKNPDPKQTTEKLEDLTEDSSRNGIGDVEAVSAVLSNIGISSDVSDTNKEEISPDVTKGILNVVSNLVKSDLRIAPNQNDTASASKISGSMVNQIVNVAKRTTEKSKIINSPRVAVIDIAKDKDVGNQPKETGIVAFTLPQDSRRDKDLQKCAVGSGKTKKEDTILLIETKKGEENEEVDMAVVLITDSTLMPDTKISVVKKDEKEEDDETVDKILHDLKKDMEEASEKDGADSDVKKTFVNSFITEVKIENAPEDFKLNLFMKPTIDIGDTNSSLETDSAGKRIQVTYICAKYVPEKAKWEEDCETIYNTAKPADGVLCLCSHNTSFAVLMSAYEIDRGYAEVQSYLTYVLLGVSTVGLLLTLVFLLPAKALRSTRSAKINICFTTALLLASLMFLIQDAFISAQDTGVIKLKSTGCAVYAMIQHYLWLVVFVWMVVEGFLMYLSLVQVFGSHISKYMLKFNLAAWGIPLPIPFIGYFVFTKKHTVGSFDFTDHGYLADTMCFIKPDSVPFYALFLAPIVLVILINLVFFALVAKVIKNSKSSGNISDQEQILRQLKAAVGVMVLLGTGWFFGIFMSVPAPQFQVGMQYLFILLNSTQGIFVFLFYIVLNDQVKSHWLVKMGLQEEKRTTTSSSAAGKSAATKATAVSVSAAPNQADNIYENPAASNEEHTYASAEYATASDKAGKHEFPVKSDNNANI